MDAIGAGRDVRGGKHGLRRAERRRERLHQRMIAAQRAERRVINPVCLTHGLQIARELRHVARRDLGKCLRGDARGLDWITGAGKISARRLDESTQRAQVRFSERIA